MTKEILMEIINQRLYMELALTVIVYSLVWLVTLKLGFQLLGIKMELKQIFTGVLTFPLYSLFAKQFIPILAFALVTVVLITLFLKIFGKVAFIKALWAAFLVIAISSIGNIVIEGPLCSLDKNIASFFLHTAYGNIVGSIIEMLFPALVLFILSTFKISLIPSVKRSFNRFDLVGILTFSFLFYLVYSSSIRLWFSFHNNPKFLLLNLISEWAAAAGSVLGYYIIHTSTQKKRQYEQLKFEKEKLKFQQKQSERLIKTLACERREYRNRLQVMSMMAETRHDELPRYITDIADDIRQTKVDNTENPVIASILLSQKILAKEKKIEILILGKTALDDLAIDLYLLGEIISTVLDLFVENEIMSDSSIRTVTLRFDEDEDNYYFEFKNSDQAIMNFNSIKLKNIKTSFTQAYKEDAFERFRIVQEFIRELGAKPSYIVHGDHVVKLTIKLRKIPDSITLSVDEQEEGLVFRGIMIKR